MKFVPTVAVSMACVAVVVAQNETVSEPGVNDEQCTKCLATCKPDCLKALCGAVLDGNSTGKQTLATLTMGGTVGNACGATKDVMDVKSFNDWTSGVFGSCSYCSFGFNATYTPPNATADMLKDMPEGYGTCSGERMDKACEPYDANAKTDMDNATKTD